MQIRFSGQTIQHFFSISRWGIISVFYLPIALFSQSSPVQFPPLQFVENQGQWAPEVWFRAEMGQGAVFLSKNHLSYIFEENGNCNHFQCEHSETATSLKAHAIRVHFLGASAQPIAKGNVPFPTHHNYYLGSDRKKWASKVPLFQEVAYAGLYPGVDMKVFSQKGLLKYEMVLEAGVSPDICQLQYEGARHLSISPNGDLIIQTSVGAVIEKAPFAYQLHSDRQVEIPCHFQLHGDILSFEFPDGYDPTLPLVIDPVLVFGTYSGARATNWGFTATYDKWGNAFGGGIIFSQGYPTTTGAFQTTYGGGNRDITISKFSADGSQLLFSTYLGGEEGEQPHSMVAGPNGELYLYGRTFSPNFPTTPFAYDTTYNGSGDLYITKLDSSGAILASTFLGGTNADGVIDRSFFGGGQPSFLYYNYGDDARGEIVLDENKNCYIATVTRSQDFPIATLPVGAYEGGLDACIAKMSPNLDQLLWSSYFGGANDDAVYSIDVPKEDLLYITGGTASVDFPTTPESAQPFPLGANDGFVARLNLTTSTIEACTFLGTGTTDQAYFVELDRDGDVFVFGQTEGDIPIIGNPFFNWKARQFITKLNPLLDTILIQTVFGTLATPRPDISPTAFLVDNCGRIYVSGWGPLDQFQGRMPLSPDAFQDSTDGTHFYLAVFEKDMDSLIYGTYFGEYHQTSQEHVDGGTSRFDKKGIVYQAVCASCGGTSGFPTTPGAYSRTNNASNSAGGAGGCNLGLFKMDFQLPTVDAEFIPENSEFQVITSGCSPLELHFNNTSTGLASTTYHWDFDDGSPADSSLSPTHTFAQAGTYEVQLIVADPNTCNEADTFTKVIKVYASSTVDAGVDTYLCEGDSTQLLANVQGTLQYQWQSADGLSHPQSLTPFVNPTQDQLYVLDAHDRGQCPSSDSVWIRVKKVIDLQLTEDTAICKGTGFWLKATGASTYRWAADSSLSQLDIASPFAMPDQMTSYTVYGDPDSLCRDTASLTVTVFDVPETGLTASRTEVCERHLVTLVASGGMHYEWNATSYTGDTLRIWPRESRWYRVRAYNGTCAWKWDSVYVNVFTWPEAGFTAIPSGPFAPMNLQLINHSQHATSYEWHFGDRTDPSIEENPLHTYQDSGTYTIRLIASNLLGCTNSAKYTFYVDKVRYFVPNAFSPNDDGFNDHFTISGYGMEQFSFQVYNRWGQIIYTQTGGQISWDGRHQGTFVPEGVYPYTLVALGEDGLEYVKNGTITVIR